ncbi:MAG: peptidylprolyl isomerase [Caulobacter sp.]|nr:peptidylprolyl isomerase [Caulobacter sp.]
MRQLIIATAGAACLALGLSGCISIEVSTSKTVTPGPPAAADWRTPDPANTLVIETNKGQVIVELVPEVAPGHVARLVELARKGTYDGRTFFRVIDRFMAQTGDPENTGEGGTDLPNLKAEFTWRRGDDTPFVTVASPQGTETGLILSLPAVSQDSSYKTMTGDKKVSAWGTYCPGVVGMARDENPDSANSQFFLMRYAYPSLDKRYTAFGRVISGLDVIRSIKTGEPVEAPQDVMKTVRVLADIPEAKRPKVRIIDAKGPWFTAYVQRVRAEKGADFSVCDLDLPVEVN